MVKSVIPFATSTPICNEIQHWDSLTRNSRDLFRDVHEPFDRDSERDYNVAIEASIGEESRLYKQFSW